MANKYIVLEGGKFFIEKWEGLISHEELITHEREQLLDDSISHGAVGLVDARSAVFESGDDLANDVIKDYTNPNNKTSISKYAWLVGDESYEKARTLEREMQKCGLSVIVFNDLQTACTWLGKDSKEIQKHLDSIKFF